MAPADTSNSLRYASDPDAPSADASRSRLDLAPPDSDVPPGQRSSEVMRLAQEAFSKTGSWVVFYRTLLGADGVVRRLFPSSEEFNQFQQSPQYAELQEMVAALRSQDTSKGDASEPERMITIRLPESLHDALRIESEELNLSINKLCISKLLQRIEGRFVPIQQGRRRGRRPGPQGPRKSASSDAAQGAESGQSDPSNPAN